MLIPEPNRGTGCKGVSEVKYVWMHIISLPFITINSSLQLKQNKETNRKNIVAHGTHEVSKKRTEKNVNF